MWKALYMIFHDMKGGLLLSGAQSRLLRAWRVSWISQRPHKPLVNLGLRIFHVEQNLATSYQEKLEPNIF
jgi:hypothetical protein